MRQTSKLYKLTQVNVRRYHVYQQWRRGRGGAINFP